MMIFRESADKKNGELPTQSTPLQRQNCRFSRVIDASSVGRGSGGSA